MQFIFIPHVFRQLDLGKDPDQDRDTGLDLDQDPDIHPDQRPDPDTGQESDQDKDEGADPNQDMDIPGLQDLKYLAIIHHGDEFG